MTGTRPAIRVRLHLRALPVAVSAAAMALGVLALGTPAAAASSGDGIRSVVVEGDQVHIVVASSALSQQVRPGSRGLTVRVDGQPVPARVTAVSEQRSPAQARRALLLVDTSGSMAGPGLSGARSAAEVFLSEVPGDVLVGLTTFDTGVHVLVRPTTDRQALRRAVANLTTGGRTSLNDGVVNAARALGTTGSRRIVLLSDGADSASRVSAAAAAAALRSSGAKISVVQFGPDTSANAALRRFAATSGTRPVHAADAAGLAAAFTTAARTFAAQVDVIASLPASAAGRSVDVSIAVGSGMAAHQRLAVPAGDSATRAALIPARAARTSWFGSRASLPWAGGAVFVGLLGLLLAVFRVAGPRAGAARRTRDILSRYTLLRRPQRLETAPGALGDSAVARSALELAGRVTRRRGLDQRLTQKLDRAALPLRPDEWVLLSFLLAVVLSCVLAVFTSHLVLSVVLGLLGGLVVPRAFLARRMARRQQAFLQALPDALQLMAGGLASGYSLPQALDTVVREGAEPIAGELGRALSEARIGVPIEDALEAVSDRLDCEDFRWVVMAIRVQREVGGNLAGVLGTVATTMRDRARIRRQVRSLSAEGRLSAWILIGLPVLLGLFEYFFRGDYFTPMYTTPVGIVMLVGTAISMAVGALWMNKLVKVEV